MVTLNLNLAVKDVKEYQECVIKINSLEMALEESLFDLNDQ